MRRLLPLAVALLSLSACRTGGRRGASAPPSDAGGAVTADDGGSLGALRTDRLAIVPNLVGLAERDAAAFAQRAGFDVVPLVVAGQPAGVVLSQDRVAGREAPAGTPIGIRIASGRGVASTPFSRTAPSSVPAVPPPPLAPTPADMTTPRPEGPAVAAGETPFVTPTDRGVVVPPVLDRTPEQARRIVEDAGLRYREEVASGGIPGRVMDQDPPAGARRPAGTEIVVRIPAPPAPPPPAPPTSPEAPPAAPAGEASAPPPVAAEPAKVVVPSVLDKTEAVARRILEDLGLVVRGEPTASGVAGRVMDQLPAPGSTVDAGAAVVIRIPGLVVATPNPTSATPDDSGPIPETEFGSPDAAPSTALAPRLPTTEPPAPPAAPVEPPAPPAPPAPPVVVAPPIVAPPLVPAPTPDAPPPPAPPVSPTPEVPAVPPPPPPTAPPVEPPPPPVAVTPPEPAAPPAPVVVAPPEAEVPPTEPETTGDEPIFASPRRGAVPTTPTTDAGDALPPPPPPAVPAPPAALPTPEASEPPPSPPSVPPADVPAPPVPTAPPEDAAASAIPPPPASPPTAPPPPPAVPDAAPPAAPVDPAALPVPSLRAPADGAFFRLAPRVVVEVTWDAAPGATGYLLEVEEVTDGVWAAVERRVVKGTRAVVDLETVGGKATDFRWRVRTVVGRRGGKPSAWAVFHAK